METLMANHKLPLLTGNSRLSKLCYDWQSASLSWCQAPIWGPSPDFYYCQTVASLLMWGTLSDKRMGLSFTTAADPHQSSHSQVRVPWDSWPYFTVSDSRLPQPGGLGLCIYIVSPRNRMAKLCLQALGLLFVPSYDSQGCSRGIQTHILTG
jgi:hypothetical protein